MKTFFDEKIREVYESGEFEYKPENWSKLKDRLHPPRDRKHSWKILSVLSIISFKQVSAAASVLFAVGLSVSYLNTNYHHNNAQSAMLVVNPSPKLTTNKSFANSSSIISGSTLGTVIPTSATHISMSENSVPSFEDHAMSSQNEIYHSESDNLSGAQTASVYPGNDEQDCSDYNNSNQGSMGRNDENNFENSSFANQPMLYQNPVVVYPKQITQHEFSGISFVGSIGKGSNNTAYSAGVNYQTKISKRFFIDGSISLYSSFIHEVVMFNTGQAPVALRTVAGGVKEPEPSEPITQSKYPCRNLQSNAMAPQAQEKEEISNINIRIQDAGYAHLSVNPAVGFKVSQRLSAKAGIDLQRRISNTAEEGYVEANATYRPLPNYDVGITPKLGVNINEHWQTNFVYRKGINNLVSRKNYFNRDYFQLQLGYKF